MAEAHVCISGHERAPQATVIARPVHPGGSHEHTPKERFVESTPRAEQVNAGSTNRNTFLMPGTGTLTISESAPGRYVVRLNGGAV